MYQNNLCMGLCISITYTYISELYTYNVYVHIRIIYVSVFLSELYVHIKNIYVSDIY